jgi:two-component system, NarL family, nitrate/nitrite response regulator NarL
VATTITFIDDDALLLEGLDAWASAIEIIEAVRRCSTVDDFLEGPLTDIVVLDVNLADESSAAANVRRLRAVNVEVLVFSSAPRPEIVVTTLKAGAAGFVEKSGGFAALEEALATVAGGGEYLSSAMAFAISRDHATDRPHLTAREVAVLGAYASGLTMGSVARRIGISESTALTHLRRVKHKYLKAGRAAPTKLELAKRWSEDRQSFE